MEISTAVQALAALAQESRLEVFRTLVRETPGGLAASALADRLELPASTLSFHLDQLLAAGLLQRDRQGRSLIYSVNAERLHELMWFLGEDCCQGNEELCVEPTARIDERRTEASAPVARPRVLFMCSHNSARSQMGEALLRRAAGDRFEIHSCGLRPAAIHPMTLRVLEEAGLDTAGLRSKDLGEFLGKVAVHHAIVVCERANDHCPRLHPFALNLDYWPFPDPAAAEGSKEERLQVFRDVRDAIERRIEEWLAGDVALSASGGD
jgi:arsenate reductase